MKKVKLTIIILLPVCVLALVIGIYFKGQQENEKAAGSGENAQTASLVGEPVGDLLQESEEQPEAEETLQEEELPEEVLPEEPAFEPYDITMLALGDNLLHMGLINSGKQEDGSYDFGFEFEGIRDFLEVVDVAAINQETPLAGNALGFSGFPQFNGPTEVADAIAQAGFKIVTAATNHAYDRGLSGLISHANYWAETYPEILTVGIHGDHSISFATDVDDKQYPHGGAGMAGPKAPDNIAFLNEQGITIAVLNYTYGNNYETFPRELEGRLNMLCAYGDSSRTFDFTTLRQEVLDDIAYADKVADLVVVFPHWGTEYRLTQTKYQELFAQQMTDAGADLIIGAHPHVIEPIEHIVTENGKESLCFYSLGNFAHTQQKAECMLETMAWVTLHVEEDSVSVDYEKSGGLPMVCHYVGTNKHVEGVYLLEDYTEEMAAAHGLYPVVGVRLTKDYLETTADEVLGSWRMTRAQALGE